jgi:predicted amidohydrolase YtcJ
MMTFSKHPSMAFYSKLLKLQPDLFRADKKSLNIDIYKPDTYSLLEPSLQYDPGEPADLVLKNVVVYGEEEKSTQYIAIRGNIILRVGDPGTISRIITEKTTVIDAEGCIALPGFCDSHLHLMSAAQRLDWCDMEEIRSADAFRDRLLDYNRANPDAPVLYVYGIHYLDPPIIPSVDARRFLDGIIIDKPVFVYAHDLHTAWANTKAIEMAGLLHAMPPYPPLLEMLDLDGNIILGPDKIPSGEFREPEVYFLVESRLQSTYPGSIESRLRNLQLACQDLARLGFTSVHRMGLSHPAEDLSFLIMALELEQQGRLPVRINASVSSIADWNMLDDVILAHRIQRALAKARSQEMTAADLHDFLTGQLDYIGDRRHRALGKLVKTHGEEYPLLEKILEWSELIHDTTMTIHVEPHLKRDNPHKKESFPDYLDPGCKVRCNTVKIFMDGVIEKDTAYRLDQEPGEGIPEFNQQELDALVQLADMLGIQVAAHSIGDASVRSMLDAIECARQKHARIDRERGHLVTHRIEHIEMCTARDIQRFGAAHVVASMQPLHERPPMTIWHSKVPEKNWDTAFAWRDLSENGAILVYGSDWPIVSCDTRQAVHHAITRKPWTTGGRVQSIPLKQAIDAYTTNPATIEYAANCRGKIGPGMMADIVLLSGNLCDLERDDLSRIGIYMTICDGSITYDSRVEPDMG